MEASKSKTPSREDTPARITRCLEWVRVDDIGVFRSSAGRRRLNMPYLRILDDGSLLYAHVTMETDRKQLAAWIDKGVVYVLDQHLD